MQTWQRNRVIIVRKTQEMVSSSTALSENEHASVHAFLTNTPCVYLCAVMTSCNSIDHSPFKTPRLASEHKLKRFYRTQSSVLILGAKTQIYNPYNMQNLKALLFWQSHAMHCLPVLLGKWKITTLVCAEERRTLLKISFMVSADGLSPLCSL